MIMKKLLIATNNQNKMHEFKLIFKELNFDVELISPNDLNDSTEPVENGQSYQENAIIKAKFYFDRYHIPTIADDSGMNVKFLNDFPGIYSARFMSTHSYNEKNDAIIRIMEDAPNRDASFVCVIAYINENGEIKTFEGINDGKIAYKQSGDEGFGFDPLFVIPEFNKTEAELGFAYKNKYSHRALACRKLVDYIKQHE